MTITDLLPTGLTFVSATASQGSYNSANGIWTVGNVPANTTAILQVTTTVVGTTAITNTAQISASDQLDPDSTPNNNNAGEDDQSSITLTPQLADLSLSKTISNPNLTVGQPVTFTLNVNNSGPSTATGVTVTDQLPQGLTFVNASPSGVYNSTTGVWTVGTLVNGSSASLQITATVASSTAITNTAQVSASNQRDPDSTPNNNIASEDDQASVTLSPQGAGVNDPPVLAPVGNKAVDEEACCSSRSRLVTDDVPANALTLSAGGLPTGATFDPATGVFAWTPTEAQQGQYIVTFTATDDGMPNLTDSEAVTITVTEVNAPPVLAPISDMSVDENTLLQFTVSAGDVDEPGNTLTYSAAGLPAGARSTR